jgi:hypothetical protein
MARPYRSSPHGSPPYRLKIHIPNGRGFTLCATRPVGCFARASLLATFVSMATRVRNQPAPRSGGDPDRLDRPHPGGRLDGGGRIGRVRGPGGRPRRARPGSAPPPRRRRPAHPGRGHRARGQPVGPDGQRGRARASRPWWTGALGALAWVVPLLVVLLAWRYLRHPDRNSETARAAIGWTALLLGAERPDPYRQGHPASVRTARRRCGRAAARRLRDVRPAVGALTSWVAAPLLALLAAFGVLVITGTPLHRIPERLAAARAVRVHPRPARRRRRRLEIDEDYEAGTGSTARRVRGQIARQIRDWPLPPSPPAAAAATPSSSP